MGCLQQWGTLTAWMAAVSKKEGAETEVFQIDTASDFPLKKFTNLYKILFSILVNLRLEILLMSRFYVTLH